MSIFAVIPFTEIAATFFSSVVVAMAARDLFRSRNTAAVFAEALSKRREWRDFEKKRLLDLLKDNRLSEDDWIEILSVVESIVVSETKIKGWKEMRSIYPARSEKAKRLLLSEVINTSSIRLRSEINSELA
ncbi:hypothetical protein GEU84_008100 [Fertoebacter nigrum]|uniref:Uncharacterized protein n=1 Tax=Fertoeibacter niger TaxID=2656921 RepID=A0A8X8H6X1_9RHOB|nr:hypothetical protein [Fertoeibacter niger]NUB44341.1 hypothetical protein [Fertoeibacter niger]